MKTNKKIKAIAFDMDGTLFSSAALITETYAMTITKINKENNFHLNIPTNKEIAPQLGKPIYDIYASLFPDLDPSFFPKIKELNAQHFQKLIQKEGGTLLPGVQEMFEDLKKHHLLLLIASNGGKEYLTSVVNKFHLPIDQPILTLDFEKLFVKKDILAKYLALFDLDPQEVIMVGDRIMDFEAAEANKTLFIGIKGFTYGNRSELDQAKYVVNDIPEAHQLILQILKN